MEYLLYLVIELMLAYKFELVGSLIYLVIGLLFAYGFESDDGPVLTTRFKGTLVLLVAWPLVVLIMGPAASVFKWRGKEVWRKR